jgi:hypothetical protein
MYTNKPLVTATPKNQLVYMINPIILSVKQTTDIQHCSPSFPLDPLTSIVDLGVKGIHQQRPYVARLLVGTGFKNSETSPE